jgi:diadenosine tetraphosphate (Ap4A) HIT family hydrolase
MNLQNCQFCENSIDYDKSLKERELWSESWFSVHDDKSPLGDSHHLVITKDHARAFANMDRNKMQELISLLQHQEIYNTDELRTVVFEHGVQDCKTNGCGIDHAHLHIVKLNVNDSGRFIEKVLATRQYLGMVKPTELSSCKQSYLFVWDTTMEQGHLLDGHQSESQHLRRLLGETLGVEWNWKTAV